LAALSCNSRSVLKIPRIVSINSIASGSRVVGREVVARSESRYCSLARGILRTLRNSIYSSSLPVPSSKMARPCFPARAVRPALCENVLGSVGGSYWITVSISAKSTPLAATSVQSRTAGVRWEEGKLMNDASAISRTRGGRSP
jgi:hypothetical protein